AAALVACTPSPQDTAMPRQSPDSGKPAQASPQAAVERAGSTAGGVDKTPAAIGPIPQPVSAAENPTPSGPADSPASAQGRRILSTAFVRVGPDGRLTVERRDGRVLVLRDVVMRPGDYCGVHVIGGPAGSKYCGGYAEVAAARPGGGPAPEAPDLAGPNPVKSPPKGT
ncbi:MAG TPA: hypothetical protein VF547_00345, partial [Allosphingosinicella sp.]